MTHRLGFVLVMTCAGAACGIPSGPGVVLLLGAWTGALALIVSDGAPL